MVPEVVITTGVWSVMIDRLDELILDEAEIAGREVELEPVVLEGEGVTVSSDA